MARLPHHRNSPGFLYRLRQILGCLHVEYDRLTFAWTAEGDTRLHDQQIVTPDDLAAIVDPPNSVSIPVEGDTEVRPVFLNGGSQRLEDLRDGRIGMVVGQRPIALAEQAAGLDSQFWEKFWDHERACA